jgi:flagellar motor component MotA
MEMKTPEDYFMELKSAIEIVFKNDEETRTNLVSQLQEIWDSFKTDSIGDLKEKIASFTQDVYLEEQQAKTKGGANEIRGIVDLTEELKSMFEK